MNYLVLSLKNYWVGILFSLLWILLNRFPSRKCKRRANIFARRSFALLNSLYIVKESWKYLLTADTPPKTPIAQLTD
jgi:hypothetical protein